MGKIPDDKIIGKKFNRLTVIRKTEEKDNKGRELWECKCDCGNILKASYRQLSHNEIKSCGCLREENRRYRKEHALDYMIGKKYGRLTVLKRVDLDRKEPTVLCRCDCGNEIKVSANSLRTGNTKSCGCIAHEILMYRNIRHGLHGTKLYGVWKAIRQRCNNPNCDDYKWYGMKGVKVCEEWEDFKNFYDWAMNNGYKEGLTIDRISFDGDYCPENCRWITIQEQQENKRNCKIIEYNGESNTISYFAKKYNIKRSTLYDRIFIKKYSVEYAIEKDLNDKDV